MKLLRLFFCIIWISLLSGCVSEPMLPNTAPIVGSISTRGNNYSENTLPIGSTALFNTSGDVIIKNQIFTFDGNHWKGEEDILWKGTTTSTNLTALYPAQNGDDFITEHPYADSGLIDILIAQGTITNESQINLDFKHLFSMLTIHIQSPLKESVVGISLTAPKVTKVNPNGSFEVFETHTTTPTINTEGDYTFIIPPLKDCALTLTFTLENKETPISYPLTHTFLSGYKYECNVTDKKNPGIYNAEDLIEFSKIINKKKEGDLKQFGELQEDGRMLYRLWTDIDFSDKNINELIPIGYYDGASVIFSSIFDGQGHTISNLTLPDKSINKNVDTGHSGLFGFIGNNGVVKNLHLINAQTVESPLCSNVGGIAAKSKGEISNCSVKHSSFTATSGGNVGAICGNMTDGYIINCYTQNNILTTPQRGHAGGIIGGSCGKILNCYTYNNSYKAGKDGYIGGIVSSISSSYTLEIANCYVMHSSYLNNNWGAIIGVPQKNRYIFDNLFYNGPNIIANDKNDYSNVHLYKNFTVGEKHISILLNEWIENTGKTKYQELTFKNWTISTEYTPNPAIFAE